jgi:hypothetical protein
MTAKCFGLEGVGIYQVTQRNGPRCSPAKSFLCNDIKARPKLHIMATKKITDTLKIAL